MHATVTAMSACCALSVNVAQGVAIQASPRRLKASLRSFTFWILPEPVIGKASTKITWRGILKLATFPNGRSGPEAPSLP